MVSKCGSEISPHIPAIVELCLEYLTYDPNYNYDDGDDSDMECDDDGDEENGTDDEYSDDDDVSWKVRRAAAKCLEAVILSRHELNSGRLVGFYQISTTKKKTKYRPNYLKYRPHSTISTKYRPQKFLIKRVFTLFTLKS